MRVYDMDIANLFLFCAIQGDMAFTLYFISLHSTHYYIPQTYRLPDAQILRKSIDGKYHDDYTALFDSDGRVLEIQPNARKLVCSMRDVLGISEGIHPRGPRRRR